jgi:hypothetical protein
VLLFLAMPAFAGRPFTTEDAAVLEDKACQVEAYVNHSRDATTGWLVPSCNFGMGIQWQAGGARTREDGHSTFSETYVQAKTVFPSADGSPWKAGLVLGVIRRPREPEHNGWDNPFVIVPVSYFGENMAVHVNAGSVRDAAANRNLTLWGVAGEAKANERWTLLGEVFGENSGRPFIRVGARFAAIKDQLDVDVSAVTRPGGTREERFVSLGVTWVTGRILP